MPSRTTYLLILLAAVVLVFTGCTSSKDHDQPTGPTGEVTLTIEAHPSTISADGESQLVVFTEMRQGGEPVADSTEIILLRTIGSLGRGIVYTQDGVALDTLTSDTVAGSGWLIAYSQGIRDSVEIMFTETP
jgi:hypothetical protein